MTTKYKTEISKGKFKVLDYAAKDSKCSKKDCFVPFQGNGRPICRLYELGKCKENKNEGIIMKSRFKLYLEEAENMEEPKGGDSEKNEGEHKETDLYEKAFAYLSKVEAPDDESGVHKKADKIKENTHEFEETIYKMLGGFLSCGKHKGFKGEYDPKQLAMGIKVEQEHFVGSSLPQKIIDMMAEKIAKDHLAEHPDYYTVLASVHL